MAAESFVGAIIFCPVCCSNQDVDETGWVEAQCASCGTQFKVNLQPDVVATHSMTG